MVRHCSSRLTFSTHFSLILMSSSTNFSIIFYSYMYILSHLKCFFSRNRSKRIHTCPIVRSNKEQEVTNIKILFLQKYTYTAACKQPFIWYPNLSEAMRSLSMLWFAPIATHPEEFLWLFMWLCRECRWRPLASLHQSANLSGRPPSAEGLSLRESPEASDCWAHKALRACGESKQTEEKPGIRHKDMRRKRMLLKVFSHYWTHFG